MRKTVRLVYSTHRPETLKITAKLMEQHDTVLLEEPPHTKFRDMLEGRIAIEEYMLDQDLEYPEFSRVQNEQLRRLFRHGKIFHQVEPFVEQLLHIHFFFADNNSPSDLDKKSTHYQVYQKERDATRKLIQYYTTSQHNDFDCIVAAVQQFAKADAARFMLRDTMRAEKICSLFDQGRSFYIEAGPIHVLLEKIIEKQLPRTYALQTVSVEQLILQQLGLKGSLFSPGDVLTLSYIFNDNTPAQQRAVLAARSLIYAKAVTKEEMFTNTEGYPHTRNEHATIQAVNSLEFDECRKLFFSLRKHETRAAKELLLRFRSKKN